MTDTNIDEMVGIMNWAWFVGKFCKRKGMYDLGWDVYYYSQIRTEITLAIHPAEESAFCPDIRLHTYNY